MGLFQQSVLNKYIEDIDNQQLDQAWSRFTNHFHNPSIQENIRESKEEQYQGEFLIDLFVNILGYVKNPTPNFNLTTELKNVKDSKKADGAILQDEKAVAVIELKGTNTVDLSKVELQAFGYKNNQPGCTYVVTSNFEKLRFYIDNAVDYEAFNLFGLSKQRFKVLWLCLHAGNLLEGTPKQIKAESLTHEESVTKKLYKEYSAFRSEIFDNILKNNPQHDKLVLFKKTQKLLDRFLFIFFAEDRLLLPPNSIREIVNQWTDLRDKYDEYQPLYSRFNKYFGYMNVGYRGQKHDIFAYNGGLFAPDEVLDTIRIDDQLLYKHTLNLSNYDFESEVSVNILGHIFEHSLTEIENMHAQLEGGEIEKSKTKRKKDGVFYTPKYITKYIVDSTVGRLCKEKKLALKIVDDDYEKERKGRRKTTLKVLLSKLDTYRKWLLGITICDPACGSGAFLNQTLEYLIAEHRYIDELQTKLLGDGLVLSNVESAILENNLFGVDINEESIDIAKLSLWLRTAKKGRKLTSLSKNIKCGNSLIDDHEVAGAKAFDWQNEFPKIFEKGGFDVVIGNPPYGAHLSKYQKDWFKANYQITQGVFDTYLFFFEKTYHLLKRDGLTGVITPNTFLVIENGDSLRRFLYERMEVHSFLEVFNVFPDAVVEPVVSIFRKRKRVDNYEFIVKLIDRGAKPSEVVDSFTKRLFFNRNELFENSNLIFNYRINQTEKALLNKIVMKSTNIGEVITVKAGVKPYEKGKGKPSQSANVVKEKPFNSFDKQSSEWKKVIRGTDVVRHQLKWSREYINYGQWLAAPRNPSLFSEPKIFMRRTDDKLMCHLDDTGMVGINSVHCIFLNSNNTEENLLIISALLNSKLLNWVFQMQNFHMIGKPLAEVKVVFVERLPYIEVDAKQQELLRKKVIRLSDIKSDLSNFQQKLLNYLEAKYSVSEMNRKLQNWHELAFAGFIKTLNKAIVNAGGPKLSKTDEIEWMEIFEENKSEAQILFLEVEKIDREIDHMVYALYGLSNEEISIVENSIS